MDFFLKIKEDWRKGTLSNFSIVDKIWFTVRGLYYPILKYIYGEKNTMELIYHIDTGLTHVLLNDNITREVFDIPIIRFAYNTAEDRQKYEDYVMHSIYGRWNHVVNPAKALFYWLFKIYPVYETCISCKNIQLSGANRCLVCGNRLTKNKSLSYKE